MRLASIRRLTPSMEAVGLANRHLLATLDALNTKLTIVDPRLLALFKGTGYKQGRIVSRLIQLNVSQRL